MNIEKYKKRTKDRVSSSTLSARVSGQRNLDEFIGGGEPTVEDVEEWVDHLIDKHHDGDIKASTIKEYFKAARYYFKTVKGEPEALDHIDWIPSNDSDPGDYLTVEEWERLYDNIHNVEFKAIYSLMYHYARRPSEIRFLNREDVYLGEDDDRTVSEVRYLNDDKFDESDMAICFLILKKTDPNLPTIAIDGEERKLFRATYELKEEPAKLIKEHMQWSPEVTETIIEDGEEREVTPLFCTPRGRRSYESLYNECKKAAARAGIDSKNVTPKTMRHSRATHLDWDGNAPGNIGRDMLIHEPDTNVIGRYIHDRGEDEVREVMDLRDDE